MNKLYSDEAQAKSTGIRLEFQEPKRAIFLGGYICLSESRGFTGLL